MSTKAEFAQDFAVSINENFADAKLTLKVPEYIKDALNFIKS
jgi:phage-related holin